MPNRIVFIDSNIAEYQTLLPQISADSEIFILSVKLDGVLQILEALKNTTDLQAIDIISHGKPGALLLGNGELNAANLGDYIDVLNRIGSHLSPNGDILLYGCEVAQGKVGQKFIQDLAQLTGANVAASKTKTGNTDQQCEWILGAQVGKIQTTIFDLSYQGVLGNFTGTTGDDVLTGTAADDLFTGGAGNDTLIGGAGNDIAIYSGNQADYEISINSSGQIIVHDTNLSNGDEGEDTLSNIETFRFADGDFQNSKEFYEFRVNTYTSSYQYIPTIASLADGGFVIVWMSILQDGSLRGIYAQRYDSYGIPEGSEFRVNSTTLNDQYDASVAELYDGGFVITWTSKQNGNEDIYAQRYDANGNPLNSEFKVNSNLTSSQHHSSVSALHDGGFIVTWSSDGHVYSQRFNANGISQGGEFKVNTYSPAETWSPRVTVLANGGSVISWNSNGQDGDGIGIFAQRFDANGIPQGNEFQVNTYTTSSQFEGSITALKNGGFVVAWMSEMQDGYSRGIYAQRYDENGIAQGGEFRVNTTTIKDQSSPSVVETTDGGFVVTWSHAHDNVNEDIYAQSYDANGFPSGSEFLVNTTTNGLQLSSDITGLNNGGLVVTWTSELQDGSLWEVYAQRYDANVSPVGVLSLSGDEADNKMLISALTIVPSKLSGMAGNDFLQGGFGNDILEGGN